MTQKKTLKIKTRKHKTERTASVELELEVAGNATSISQNLLLDASTSSAVHDIASSFGGINESPSIVSSSSGQVTAAATGGKKESHLFGWFASSTSTSASSAVQNMSVTSTSSSATTSSPQTVANRSNVADTNGGEGASPPSTKISSKLSYGEKLKFNKNGNKATTTEHPTVDAPPPAAAPKEQQKSSRRTTSLLNLFMSNSQGKKTQQIHTQTRVFACKYKQAKTLTLFHSPSLFVCF